ncbi:hypothetical protein PVAND_008091 [Polypedilum vanderplanki]|uniref:Uncharacterized protein n=1 Tax=Polypedilum vanderplanki TaxID=319348 RepID=A0A9J6C8N3_POLVA|nr:hypothetical protein PVAND_008091 [Polypedilum vanderplanki]
MEDIHRIGDIESCDQKKLLLKKNHSWTHINETISSSNNNLNSNCNSLAKANCLRISRSNPHVFESLPSNLKFKLPSLQQISSRFHSQMLTQNGKNKRLAPLAKAISFSSTVTTYQTQSTPTAIRFNNIQRYKKFDFICKVNKLFEKI